MRPECENVARTTALFERSPEKEAAASISNENYVHEQILEYVRKHFRHVASY